jgi:tRNA A-37 threonylcarbamoyl transferase component Bud32
MGPARDTASPGRFRWCFAPLAQDLREAIAAIPWDALETCAAANRVKVAENRDVWRIDLPGRTIYAKCYRSQGPVKRLAEFFRGLAAKREWQALRTAAAIGVQAPEALGYATGRGLAYSALLVTAAMPAGAQSLEEAWLAACSQPDPEVSRRCKSRLIDALADLIARAHVGGLFHRDLHVGNILIFPHNGTVTAALIDLHNARLCSGVALSGVRDNLVQLNQWFARHASRTERLRFLRTYCRHLQGRLSVSPAEQENAARLYGHKAFAQHVLHQSHRYAARLYAKRDRRIFKRNKYFATLALPDGWSARVALDIKHGRPYHHPLSDLPDKKSWRDVLADPAALLSGPNVHVLKSSAGRQVAQVDLPFAGVVWTIIAKHEQSGSLVQWFLRHLGRNPLRREFLAGWRCLHRELPVALPLALLTREGPSRQESILLSEYVTDSRDLDTYVKMHLPEVPAAEALRLKRLICQDLASVLRRMWTCHLAHRDLKAANIRLQIPRGDIDKLKIVLVDIDGIRPPRGSLRKALLRSLARLDASFASTPMVTRTDRLRLLLAVLRGIDSGTPKWREAWRQIRRLSLRDQETIAKQLPWLQPIARATGAQ